MDGKVCRPSLLGLCLSATKHQPTAFHLNVPAQTTRLALSVNSNQPTFSYLHILSLLVTSLHPPDFFLLSPQQILAVIRSLAPTKAVGPVVARPTFDALTAFATIS